jgi:myo-inositol 2-dehydrogenase / D-chiro-inositol 1-dehydrogenase
MSALPWCAIPWRSARRLLPNWPGQEKIANSVDEVLEHKEVGAVIISTPTETHADYMERAARTGKAIFCEKPVSLYLSRAAQAVEVVKECKIPFQIGFDRRFDPGYSEVKRRIDAGALGQIDQFVSVLRDPAPPTKEIYGQEWRSFN